ncbi:PvcB protein [Pseudomonas chlororaphis subsp. aurantiaca]|nr:PvcB protein [Pseudomonas chlororaphis subsp. aurantiaca]
MVNYLSECVVTANNPFGVILTPSHPFQRIIDLPVDTLRAMARQHQLLLLRGFKSDFVDQSELTRYAEQWGDIMMWPFGAVLNIREYSDAKDHIFDSSYVPMHWDGMYKPTIPEFQIFHCVDAPGQQNGGRTDFSNTKKLLAEVDAELLSYWRNIMITYRIEQVAHYGGKVTSSLIESHPYSDALIMRYNEPAVADKRFINRHVVECHDMSEAEQDELHRTLHGFLYDERYYYSHQWQTGDIVIADNLSLLHGREGFIANTPRHLQRVHIQASPVYMNKALQ